MKIQMIGIFLLTIFASSTFGYAQQFVIRNVNIVDVEKGEILKSRDVEIQKGKIKAIHKRVSNFKGKVIEGKGKYLIPGLWDMHVHLSMVGDATMPLFLNYGITGVRDMGGDIELINEYKKNLQFPHIVSAGPILESPRFYQIVKMLMGAEMAKTRVSYGDPEKARQLIDSLINSGSDFIKIRTVQNQEALTALGKAAQEKGISLSGHVDPNLDLLAVIRSGIASIEHTEFFQVLEMDEAERKELAKSVAKEDIHSYSHCRNKK